MAHGHAQSQRGIESLCVSHQVGLEALDARVMRYPGADTRDGSVWDGNRSLLKRADDGTA